jgi:hypothetical protein
MQPARIEGDLFHNVHLSNITEDETQNPKVFVMKKEKVASDDIFLTSLIS